MFNLHDWDLYSKNLFVMIASYSAVFFISRSILKINEIKRDVNHNEISVTRLYSRLERLKDEIELKK